MKKLLIICLFFLSQLNALDSDSQAWTQPLNQLESLISNKYSNDKFISSKEIQGLPDDVLENINKHLIGDDIKAAEEFIAALDIKIEIKNIKEIHRTFDHKFLVVFTFYNVFIIQVDLGQVVHVIKHTDEVNNIVLSKNSQFIVTSSNDGTSKVYFFTNKVEKVIQHQGRVTSVAVCNDDKFIFTCSEDRISKVSLILSSEKLITIKIKSDYKVVQAQITSDEKYIVMLTLDDKIQVFDTLTYEKFQLKDNNFFIEDHIKCNIKASNMGTYLFVYYNNTLEIYDIENRAIIDKVNFAETFNILNVYGDDRYVLIKANSLQVKYKLYNIQLKQFVSNAASDYMNKDDLFIDTPNNQKLITFNLQSLYIKDLMTNQVHDLQFNNKITKIKVTLDTKYLIITTEDQVYRIYDLKLNTEVYVSNNSNIHPNNFFNESVISADVIVSPCSRYVIIKFIAHNQTLIIHDLHKNLELKKMIFDQLDFIYNDFYENNLTLVTNYRRRIFFLNLELNEPIYYEYEDLEYIIQEIKKSNNGRFIVIVGHCIGTQKSKIKIVDVQTKELIHSIEDDLNSNIILNGPGRWLHKEKILIDDKYLICNDYHKVNIHRLDKTELYNLTPLQIKLITWLYTQKSINNIRVDNNQEIKTIKLNEKMTEIFESLPTYVKNALSSNYKNLEFYSYSDQMIE